MSCEINGNKIKLVTPDKKSSFGLNVLMFAVFVYVGRIQEVFSFLSPLRIGLIVTILMLIVFIRNFSSGEFQRVFITSKELKCFLFLIVTACFSTLFSTVHSYSLLFLTDKLSGVFLIVMLIIASVRSIEDVRRVVWVYVINIIILAAPSLYGMGTQRWRSSDLTYDSNDIALIMVTAVPIIISFMSVNRGMKKAVLLFALIAALSTVVASQSRGGFIGLVIVLIMILVKTDTISTVQKMLITSLLVAAFFLLTPEAFRERIGSIGKEDYNQTATFGRQQIWERGFKLMLQNPILGVGPNCFEVANAYAYEKDVGGIAWHATAHNSYLLIGVELGFTGFALYVSMLLSAIRSLRTAQLTYCINKETKEHLWFAQGLQTSIIGFMICGFFLSFCYHTVSYFLVFIGVAYRMHIIPSKQEVGYAKPRL